MKVRDIPTERFNEALDQLQRSGWVKTYEYDNFDAWIDHGKVVLKKGGSRIVMEWDNWCEGEIEGPADVVRALGLG
ncbi:MAG: hypothetical protein OXU20_07500 [Myxococcales bacterium]|nr:hypothetical protein [Myxococcales bacterium]MDD9966509.1 hypothetical protein [Myxococcales bacterium]